MNRLHLRFTPCDISGYTFNFLCRYDKYILAQEDLDDQKQALLHFHIYIETNAHPDSVRDLAKSHLRIPKGGSNGQKNKYYALFKNWDDPSYMCKYNNILESKGYTEAELVSLVVSGKKKYLDKVEKSPAENSVTAETKTTTPKSPRIGVQQQVIALASAEWYKYKKQQAESNKRSDTNDLVEIVCKSYREVARGLNPFQIRDICYAVLYDDLDYREYCLNKIISQIQV